MATKLAILAAVALLSAGLGLSLCRFHVQTVAGAHGVLVVRLDRLTGALVILGREADHSGLPDSFPPR